MKRNYKRVDSLLPIILWGLPLAFLLFFYFQPLFANFKVAWQAATLSNFLDNNWKIIARPLGFTFWQAFLSTLLTIVVGLPAAFLMAKFRFFGKSIVRMLITIPFIMPTVVVAAGFNALLGPRGWFNLLLQSAFGLDQPPIKFLNTLGAILLAHVFYNSTVFIRVLSVAWAKLDPEIESAARTLGASPFQVFTKITLPLLKPAFLSALLLVFLFNFTSFAVILLLGGPRFSTIEVEIYIQALHMLNLPLAGSLAAIQLFFTLILTIIYTRMIQTNRFGLTPRDEEEVARPVRNKKERLFLAGMLTCMLLLFVLPLISLVFRSFLSTGSVQPGEGIDTPTFTLAYYQELFINQRGSLFYVPPGEAILNSLYFGLITVGIALSLGYLAAKAISSGRGLGKLLDPILMLPIGTSAVTLGLGFILVFNKPPIDARSFPFLVPIAHSLVAMPFVVRILQPMISAIPPQLKQAAQVLGASPWKTFWQVEFPILFKGSVSAALFAFTISLGEFGATTFISRPETPTIPIAIYRFLSQPGSLNYGQAMAMSTILMAICALAIILIDRLDLPKINEF